MCGSDQDGRARGYVVLHDPQGKKRSAAVYPCRQVAIVEANPNNGGAVRGKQRINDSRPDENRNKR